MSTKVAIIDPIDAGVNRLDTDVRSGQAVEAIDVINDDGDLRRRPAIVSVMEAAPHVLPEGATLVRLYNGSSYSTPTNNTDPSITTAIDEVLVGVVNEQFCGVQFENASYSGTPSAHTRVKVLYWDGSEWAEVPWHRDTTVSYGGNYSESLTRNGRISWHLDAIKDTWATTSVDSVTAYWIKLQIIDRADGTQSALKTTAAFAKPGLKAFHYAPVNGLFPVRIGTQEVVVVASDRADLGPTWAGRRGEEQGAMLGVAKGWRDQTERLDLVVAEHAGTYSQPTTPLHKKGTVGSMATVGSTGTTRGTADQLRRETSEAWFNDSSEPQYCQFRGGPAYVIDSTVVDASSTDEEIVITDPTDIPQHKYEHFLARVTEKGAGGAPMDEERVVWWSEDDTLKVSPPFSADIDGDNGFVLFRPHARVEVRAKGTQSRDYAVAYNTDQEIQIATETGSLGPTGSNTQNGSWESQPASDIDDQPVHFAVKRELRWLFRSGLKWTAAYDPVKRRLILTNGKTPLLVYDGRRLRAMTAGVDASTDLAAQIYSALLDEDPAEEINRYGVTTLGKLMKKPPMGRFVTIFKRRTVVANLPGFPTGVRWSGADAAMHVWPHTYGVQVFDGEARDITGMRQLNNSLIIYTVSSVFEADFSTQGYLQWRPIHRGVGFTAHDAVQEMAGALVGPGVDGVYLPAVQRRGHQRARPLGSPGEGRRQPAHARPRVRHGPAPAHVVRPRGGLSGVAASRPPPDLRLEPGHVVGVDVPVGRRRPGDGHRRHGSGAPSGRDRRRVRGSDP